MVDVICPFCGQPSADRTRFEGIWFCNRHGRFEWFDRSRLEDVDLIKIYQAYPYNSRVNLDFAVMRPRYIRGLERRILRYYPKCRGLSYLDVGCANGEYLESARGLGLSRIEGVEIDAEAAAKAGRIGPVFRTLDEISKPFDIVQCKNVLSNIMDFHGFFSGLLRLVKPGGILFFDVLNQFSLAGRAKKWLGRPGILRPPFVINGFSATSINFLAENHGARTIRLQTTYCGSDFLPYRRNIGLVLRGQLSIFLRAGTMIVADIKPG